MTGPPAPVLSGVPLGRGILISIDSNLPYSGLNTFHMLWDNVPNSILGTSQFIGLYAPRFYLESTSSEWTGTIYVRMSIVGQGDDDDSPESNEIAVQVNPSAASPPVPDGPALTLRGIRDGIRVRLGNLAQDPDQPDFQSARVTWREIPSTITQTLYQIEPSAVTSRYGPAISPGLDWEWEFAYTFRIARWKRTKTGDADWTAWTAKEVIDLPHRSSGETGEEFEDFRDFNDAVLATRQSVLAISALRPLRGLLRQNASGQWQILSTTGGYTTLQQTLRNSFDFEPADYVPNQTAREGHRSLEAAIAFRTLIGNHHYNVVIGSDNSVWWFDNIGVLVGMTQDWSARNVGVPDGISLDGPLDDWRPLPASGLLNTAMAQMATAAQLGTSAPSDIDSSKLSVAIVSENVAWGAIQTVLQPEYDIDMLTTGTRYQVAAAVRSWATGPYTSGIAEAGAVGSPPVVRPPRPAIGFDTIVLPMPVDSGQFVASVTVDNGGSGYTSAPTVRFSTGVDRRNSNGNVVQAVAAKGTATVVNGAVTAVTVTDGGTGYGDFTPDITFEGGGGSGAQATAVMAEHEIVENMQVEYRGTTLIGQTEAPWRTLRNGWRGDSLEKSGFAHGSMIDLRVSATSASGTSSATTSGIVVGFTDEEREIMPGWFDRDPGGPNSLFRQFASLIESEEGTKFWQGGLPDLVVDSDADERRRDGIRRIRGIWRAGVRYNFGDLCFRYATVNLGGTALKGMATFVALNSHFSSNANRPPNALSNTFWAMESPPQELGGTAPEVPPPGDSENPPPKYRVRLIYNRAISEAHGGVQPRQRGEYKFGSGGAIANAAYESADLRWDDIMRHTTLAVAPTAVRVNIEADDAGPDQISNSAALIWQSVIYGTAEGNPDNNFEERIAAVFAQDRWVESQIVSARISANTERYVMAVIPQTRNESGGTEDIELNAEVEFRVRLKELIEDNQVTNAALPLAAFNVAATPGEGQVAATWELPDLGATTRDRVVVSIRLQGDFFLGDTKTLPSDATSHTFTDLDAGTYDLFVLTINDAGPTTVTLNDLVVT